MASVRTAVVPPPLSLSGCPRRRVRPRHRPSVSPTQRPPAAGSPEGGRTPFPSAGLGAPILGAPQAAQSKRRPRKPAAADSVHDRPASFRYLLRDQGHHFRRADRGDRPRPACQAGRRFRTRGNPRHRQRDHRDQEYRDVDLGAGRPARRHLQRRARLWTAGAAAGS